jgi:hypothetical protein
MTRRALLATPAAAALAAASRLPIKKAVLLSMLPKSMSMLERFKLAIDCGFEQIECQPPTIKRRSNRSNARLRNPGCAFTRS